MSATLAALLSAVPAPRQTDGPKFSSLFLLIPAVLTAGLGVWGLRNAETQAKSVPLDERTQLRRHRTYRRGAIACLVVAAAFVLLIILSFLPVGAPR